MPKDCNSFLNNFETAFIPKHTRHFNKIQKIKNALWNFLLLYHNVCIIRWSHRLHAEISVTLRSRIDVPLPLFFEKKSDSPALIRTPPFINFKYFLFFLRNLTFSTLLFYSGAYSETKEAQQTKHWDDESFW